MTSLSKAMIDSAAGSVELALGLVGVMTLFLGLVKVAEAGGMMVMLARLIRPIMVRLFPRVPPDHPAMGAMILNVAANGLGLGNAATPFGIKAMKELDTLNSRPGTATDAMALFLAINTSNVTLLPTGVIALRAAAGSADPAGILPTTLFATLCSTLTAVIAARLYGWWARGTSPPPIAAESVFGNGRLKTGRSGGGYRRLSGLGEFDGCLRGPVSYPVYDFLWKGRFSLDPPRSDDGVYRIRRDPAGAHL